MKNWQTYIIIAFLIIVLFMMMKMNKTMNLQTSLLIGMAGKLGFKPEDTQDSIGHTEEDEEEEYEETDEEREAREEKDLVEGMLALSEEIKAKGPLSKKEKKYYTDNFDDMHEDLNLANPSEIIVDDESKPNTPKENKKLNAEEKRKMILTFFSDNTPKQLSAIDKMLADKTGTQPNKGNTHTRMKEMMESKEVIVYKTKGNVFYVLPEWMDGKKLKTEFLDKIS